MDPVFSVAAASYAARTGAIRWRGYSLVEADVNSKVLRVIKDNELVDAFSLGSQILKPGLLRRTDEESELMPGSVPICQSPTGVPWCTGA